MRSGVVKHCKNPKRAIMSIVLEPIEYATTCTYMSTNRPKCNGQNSKLLQNKDSHIRDHITKIRLQRNHQTRMNFIRTVNILP